MDCYVLCATLHNTEDVRRQFGASDSCIAIDDILGFANAVSLKIPYFTSGFEGPVIYQERHDNQKEHWCNEGGGTH
jgi:hypothetical protein